MVSGYRCQVAVVSGLRHAMELLKVQGMPGDAGDPEEEEMMPFLDVAVDHTRYTLVRDVHVADVERMDPQRQAFYQIIMRYAAARCWTAG